MSHYIRHDKVGLLYLFIFCGYQRDHIVPQIPLIFAELDPTIWKFQYYKG